MVPPMPSQTNGCLARSLNSARNAAPDPVMKS
jgi:hypothetical protein